VVTGVAPPGEDRLPPGPHRTLLEALHSLYEGAAKPGLRRIAHAIANGEYRDTISHEKVGALLRGDGLPGWMKVECVVRQLAAWHNPRLDPDGEAARFIPLWLAADRARRAGQSRPAATAAPEFAFLASDPMGPAAALMADGSTPSGLPGEPGLPSVVRGRDEIIGGLSRSLDPQHCPGRPQVLVGAAGIGKSTVAHSVAVMARRQGPQRQAWWVGAADEERLSPGTWLALPVISASLRPTGAAWALVPWPT
jgi:hypothetical protein